MKNHTKLDKYYCLSLSNLESSFFNKTLCKRKICFLKGTYPNIANLTHYYNVWTGYYNGTNTNARIARDINLLQTVYTFFEYSCKNQDNISKEQAKIWISEKTTLKTDLGHQLFDRLITQNSDFRRILELLDEK